MSFAARTIRTRVPALARGYAAPPVTVSDAAGVKVTAIEDGARAAAISVVVKAGSRYESQPGLAHVLKNSLFKGTNKRSTLRLVRETEFLGGVLSSSLSREHLVLTAEFTKGNEAYFAEVLGDAVSQAKFAAHEYNEEVLPSVAAEYEQAILNQTSYAVDLAHGLAFRTGLGNSLLATPQTPVSHSAATSFAASALNKSNLAVVGSNVAPSTLQSLVGEFFTASGSALQASKTSYFGGEVRVPAAGVHGPAHDTFVVAFEGQAAGEAELAVLRYILGGDAAVKWSAGTSPLSKLATPSGKVEAFNLAYSDAGLFGIVANGQTAEVSSLVGGALSALKAAAGGVSGEQLAQAVAKAKFAAANANAFDGRVNSLELLGSQIVSQGSAHSLESVFSKLDGVSADAVAKAAATVLKSKPSVVAVGNIRELPYADSLNL